MRSCVKTGCRWPASATLSFRYATAEVWLSDLAEEHPSTHDLCPHHADALTVPNGWTLVDDRRPKIVPHEPSAAELADRANTLRQRVDDMLESQRTEQPTARSRYQRLLDALPKAAPTEDAAPVGSQRGDGETAPVRREDAVDDLAPVIREIAADLAGPVVGPIQIDLTHVNPPARDQSDRKPTAAGGGAVVVELPLRHDDRPAESDSTVE